MLTCLEQSLPRLNPHREQPAGQSGLGDRWRVPAAARMRSRMLCRQEPAFFPKDSLREAARACLAAQGAGAGLWRAKATCCISRRPVPASWLMQSLSAGTPGTVTSLPSWSCLLRAQLQPHNIHTAPSAPAQATPPGLLLAVPASVVPSSQSCARSGGDLEAEWEQGKPSKSPWAQPFIFPQL